MRDFRDEVPGYEQNRSIAKILDGLDLAPREEAVKDNLRTCYAKLIEHGIFPDKEIILVDAWLKDLAI